MAGEEQWYEFVRKQCGEAALDKLKKDKIDHKNIQFLNDADLSAYMPAIGDRLAVRNYQFDERVDHHAGRSVDHEYQKRTVFARLRERMELKSKSSGREDDVGVGKAKKKKGNMKSTRMIEIGWLHEGKQVRNRMGGGTRKLSISRHAGLNEILNTAKDLFFPRGKSKHGAIDDVSCAILDFKETPLPDGVTIADIYEEVKMGIIRVYLATYDLKVKDVNTAGGPLMDLDLDSTVVKMGPASPNYMFWEEDETVPFIANYAEIMTSTPISDSFMKPGPSDPSKATTSLTSPIKKATPLKSSKKTEPSDPTRPNEVTTTSTTRFKSSILEMENFPLTLPDIIVHSNARGAAKAFKESTRSMAWIDHDLLSQGPTATVAPRSPIDFEQSLGFEPTLNEVVDSPVPTIFSTFGPDRYRNSSDVASSTFIRLHRTTIMEEMVANFKNLEIEDANIKFTFVNEKGIDSCGVSRDAYTEFWKELFLRASEGEESRVPVIMPMWQDEEWKAVGRILGKGYKDHGFFPLMLAEAFTVALVLGEEKVTPDCLFESFMSYLSPVDRDVFKQSITGSLDEEGKDLFMELLDRFGFNSVPSDNIKGTVIQMAHKELIQKPMYVLDKMSEVARDGLKSKLPNAKAIKEMYLAKKPSARRLIQLLSSTPNNKSETASFKFLKRFIGALDDGSLKGFLRLITGADSIIIDSIIVTYNELDGLERRPLFRTCGANPTLELPSTYQTYPDFRMEMTSVINHPESYRMDMA